jgi:hypothetical protein
VQQTAPDGAVSVELPPDASGPDIDSNLSPEQLSAIGGEAAVALLRVTFDKADCSGIGNQHVVLEVVELGRGPLTVKKVRWSGPLYGKAPGPRGLVVGGIEVKALPARKAPCLSLVAADGHLRAFVRVDDADDGRQLLSDVISKTKKLPGK